MESVFRDLPEEKRAIVQEIEREMQAIHNREIDVTNDTFRVHESDGYRFPPGFLPATAKKYFDDFEIEENTIILCSYPKTGTNWTMEIIRQIIYGADSKLDVLTKNLPPLLCYIEIWKPEKFQLYEHLPLPRKLLNTHLPAGLVDFEKIKKAKGKVIVPIRNPKDQAVSWFHFTKQFQFDLIRDELSPDWSQFFTDYVQGKHPTISKSGEWYPEFLLSWYKYKDEENVMMFHFEDMKKDPETAIRNIADFLEVELTDDRVAAIAKATSFDAMRNRQEKGEDAYAKMQAAVKMMRKGQAGGWKDTFTVRQSELMDGIIEEKLGHTDIKFRYE